VGGCRHVKLPFEQVTAALWSCDGRKLAPPDADLDVARDMVDLLAKCSPTAEERTVLQVRVRVKILGSQKCRIVGESQAVLIMIDPIISTRTRTTCVRAHAIPSHTGRFDTSRFSTN
jgi:hypothetical protein